MQSVEIIRGSHLKKILQHSGVYTLSSLLTKGVNLFLLPVYTRYLSPSEYGALQNVMVIAGFIGIFISLYLDNALIRFYHDRTYASDARKLLSTGLIFVLSWSVPVVFVSLMILRQTNTEVMGLPWFPYAFLTCFIALLNQLATLAIAFLRQSHRSIRITIINVVSLLVNTAVSLWLLVGLGWGLDGLLLGLIMGQSIAATMLYATLLKEGLIRFVFSRSLIKVMLAYSIGLLPLTASSWIFNLSDRILITVYGDTAQTGLYTIAYTLGSQSQIIYQSIFFVYGPMIFAMLEQDHHMARQRISKFFTAYWHLLLAVSLFLSLFAKEVIVIFTTGQYYEAYLLVPIIAASFFLWASGNFSPQFSTITKRRRLLAR